MRPVFVLSAVLLIETVALAAFRLQVPTEYGALPNAFVPWLLNNIAPWIAR